MTRLDELIAKRRGDAPVNVTDVVRAYAALVDELRQKIQSLESQTCHTCRHSRPDARCAILNLSCCDVGHRCGLWIPVTVEDRDA